MYVLIIMYRFSNYSDRLLFIIVIVDRWGLKFDT